MGSPQVESDRKANEAVRLVSFSEDFYLAIFETTVGQFSSGAWDRQRNDAPVVNVNYYDLRGDTVDWPTDGHALSDSSPLVRLRGRTGIPDFDLPTEAQWGFACRAGTMSAFSFDESADLPKYAWFTGNSGGVVHDVGKKLPNAWGIYDLIGCCHQWTTTSPVLGANGGPAKHADGVDPIGPGPQMGTGPFRVCKGSHARTGGGSSQLRVQRVAYRMLQRSNCQNGTLNGTTFTAEQGNTGCRLSLRLED